MLLFFLITVIRCQAMRIELKDEIALALEVIRFPGIVVRVPIA